MIVFDLTCDTGHTFEGWFSNAADYAEQHATGLLTCPLCGSDKINKRPSPSRLNLGNATQQLNELSAIRDEADRLARKLHDYIEKHFENVGGAFAAEVRKIHYGDAPERNIRGVASASEVVELHEEGIDTIALPVITPDKDKLN